MLILVIDDEKDILQLITTMLTAEGYEVVAAEDGQRGLQLLQDFDDIEIVITDLIMPNKEGIETIMDMHKIRPELKVLAMSGGGRGGISTYLSTAKNIGAAATLAKPFRKQELLDAVSGLINS
ncbi:MAG: DNA-binding NtrC family response regulator [Candidatus Azotimanducaceae bacterium]|jgi:DNA-binding NtrC family response regulator